MKRDGLLLTRHGRCFRQGWLASNLMVSRPVTYMVSLETKYLQIDNDMITHFLGQPHFWGRALCAKGSLRIKKCHKKSKKSKIRNLNFLIRGGEGYIFIFFPNVNEDFKYFSWIKNKLVLKWFLVNFKCFLSIDFFRGGVWFPYYLVFPIFSN